MGRIDINHINWDEMDSASAAEMLTYCRDNSSEPFERAIAGAALFLCDLMGEYTEKTQGEVQQLQEAHNHHSHPRNGNIPHAAGRISTRINGGLPERDATWERIEVLHKAAESFYKEGVSTRDGRRKTVQNWKPANDLYGIWLYLGDGTREYRSVT